MRKIRFNKKMLMLSLTLFMVALLLFGLQWWTNRDKGIEDMPWRPDVVAFIMDGRLKEVHAQGQVISGIYYKDKEKQIAQKFKSITPDVFGDEYAQWMVLFNPDTKISISEFRGKPAYETYIFSGILTILTMAVFIFIWWRFMGQSWWKTKKFIGTAIDKFKGQVYFKDVIGIDESKQEVEELKNYIIYRDVYEAIYARVPRGIVLYGPPGCGKTMLTKALATESGLPLFHFSGAEFVELYVGVGASRLRDVFRHARKNAPCILFIDEADSLLGRRGTSLDSAQGEYNQTISQFLIEMDGLEPRHGVVVIIATNRYDMLDPAAIRPGRFDRKVPVLLPTFEGRRALFLHYANQKPLAEDVDLNLLSQELKVGVTGADIENIVNEAATLCAREYTMLHPDEKIPTVPLVISHRLLDVAIKNSLYGRNRKLVMDDKEKELVAWHEAGHAIVGLYLDEIEPITTITVIPREGPHGVLHGFVDTTSKKDVRVQNEKQLTQRIIFLLGGRAAEELFGNGASEGCNSDFSQAVKIQLAKMLHHGMDTDLGPGALQIDLDTVLSHTHTVANPLVNEMITKAFKENEQHLEEAKRILKEHEREVREVVKDLLQYETLDQNMFLAAIKKAQAEKQ